jgi:hypothetical protein
MFSIEIATDKPGPESDLIGTLWDLVEGVKENTAAI